MKTTLILCSINLHISDRMEWLNVEDEHNQDMSYRYIGPLILKEGFKVRYVDIDNYNDELRSKFINLFYKHGYDISISYVNSFAYCEITAVKRKNKYIELALGICVIWAAYRALTFNNI